MTLLHTSHAAASLCASYCIVLDGVMTKVHIVGAFLSVQKQQQRWLSLAVLGHRGVMLLLLVQLKTHQKL